MKNIGYIFTFYEPMSAAQNIGIAYMLPLHYLQTLPQHCTPDQFDILPDERFAFLYQQWGYETDRFLFASIQETIDDYRYRYRYTTQYFLENIIYKELCALQSFYRNVLASHKKIEVFFPANLSAIPNKIIFTLPPVA